MWEDRKKVKNDYLFGTFNPLFSYLLFVNTMAQCSEKHGHIIYFLEKMLVSKKYC